VSGSLFLAFKEGLHIGWWFRRLREIDAHGPKRWELNPHWQGMHTAAALQLCEDRHLVTYALNL